MEDEMGTYLLKRIKELTKEIEESKDELKIIYLRGKLDQANEILDIYYS